MIRSKAPAVAGAFFIGITATFALMLPDLVLPVILNLFLSVILNLFQDLLSCVFVRKHVSRLLAF